MENHIRTVAALNIALGVMGMIGALATLTVLGGTAGIVQWGAGDEPGARLASSLLETIGVAVFLLVMAMSIPCIVTGMGLLGNRPWARPLGVVVSALNLLNIPFGTIVGIYGLWALLSSPTPGSQQAP
jgi:hypothetical protein